MSIPIKVITLISNNVIISNEYLFVLGVYCGDDDKVYLSCAQCPKPNDTMSNIWCNGNCVYDSRNQMCKEGMFEAL